MEESPRVLRKVAKAFGREILNQKGKLDRKKLGKIIFSSAENQKKLNQIVHPLLLKTLRARILESRKIKNQNLLKGKPKFTVIDAALITEWGLEKLLDMAVVVTSPKRERLERLQKQGLSRSEAENRIARQLSDKERLKKGDYVIINRGTLSELRKKAECLYRILIWLSVLDQTENLIRKFDRHKSK